MLNSNLSDKSNKIIFVAVAIIIIGLLFFFANRYSSETAPATLSQEEIIKKQLEELDSLRKETPPLTQEEINRQLEELNKLKTQQ